MPRVPLAAPWLGSSGRQVETVHGRGHHVAGHGVDELDRHLEAGHRTGGRRGRHGDLVRVRRIDRDVAGLGGLGQVVLVVDRHRDGALVGQVAVEGAPAVDERHVVLLRIAGVGEAVVAGDQAQGPGIGGVGQVPVLVHRAHRHGEKFARALHIGSAALARRLEGRDARFGDLARRHDLQALVAVGLHGEDGARTGKPGGVGHRHVDVLGPGVGLLEIDHAVVEPLVGCPDGAETHPAQRRHDRDVEPTVGVDDGVGVHVAQGHA